MIRELTSWVIVHNSTYIYAHINWTDKQHYNTDDDDDEYNCVYNAVDYDDYDANAGFDEIVV